MFKLPSKKSETMAVWPLLTCTFKESVSQWPSVLKGEGCCEGAGCLRGCVLNCQSLSTRIIQDEGCLASLLASAEIIHKDSMLIRMARLPEKNLIHLKTF